MENRLDLHNSTAFEESKTDEHFYFTYHDVSIIHKNIHMRLNSLKQTHKPNKKPQGIL